jgi:predicted dehydrogenase
MHRRTFLAATAASGAQLLGAGDQIRVGVIGSGGRGSLLAGEFKEVGADVAAVCDVYEPHLANGLKAASTGAKSYRDYRRLLDDKSINAVIVATPDHWHAQMMIDAVEAGKDVYVEKPLAHTIDEGFRMVEAVRRTRRVVQVGTQRRSSDLFSQARQVVASGMLGEVRLVNSWWMNHARALASDKLEGELDWAQWLGSAPKREVDPVRFHNWYWFWDYSGGMLIGQAAHIVDSIVWFMNSTYPKAVTCTALGPNVPGAEVPETCSLAIEYPENYLAVFTISYKAMRYHVFNDQMVQYHGNKARMDVGREAYAVYPESSQMEMRPSVEVKRPGSFVPATRAHIRNFLECTVSRQEPNAPVEAGNYTNVALCMGMESLRTGRRLRWDASARRAVSA